MSQSQADYITEEEVKEGLDLLHGEQPAAEIHPPKTVNAVYKKGLKEIKVWGWVKISANFIYHIKVLKGAKLAIWQVISLSIDEDSVCTLTVDQIAELSGYSRSETIESIKEMETMGYLSVDKKVGRKSMYSPDFAARGKADPSRKTTRPVRKEADPSSPSDKKAHPSIKELKTKELKDKAGKPAQPKASDIPELVLFKNLVLTYCKPYQRDLVINAVRDVEKRLGHFPTEDDLRPFWDAWRPISGNPYNIKWLTEWAVTGVIPGRQNAPQQTKGADRMANINNMLNGWLTGKEQEASYGD